VRPVFASGSDKIYEATSYSTNAGKVYDITSGTPVYFATVPADGWLGPMGVRGDDHLFAVTDADGGSLWDITAGGDYTLSTPLASNIFSSSLSYPEGLAFDSSNNAYITNSEAGSQQIAKVTSGGTVSYLTGTFDNARGLVVIGSTLYIAEGGTGKILAYDLTSNTVSTFATGFKSGSDHIAATLTLDTSGNIIALWSGASPNTEFGLYKVTSGADYAGVNPLVQYNPTPYTYIDVNQIGIDSSNNAYVAGAFYGYCWQSAYSGGSYQTFTQFASGLGDTESLAIIRAPIFPTPEFPLGSLLAIVAPGGALIFYIVARSRFRSSSSMP